MKKILGVGIILGIFLLSGCGKTETTPPAEEGMFDDGYLEGLNRAQKQSKSRINEAVEKENQKIEEALGATE